MTEIALARRAALVGAALAATVSLAARGAAGPAHDHHHGPSARDELLIDLASDCMNKGEVCLAHCLILLGEGDRAMAACARSVSETMALCDALRKLVAQGSAHAKPLARLVMNACLECQKSCDVHAQKHRECRDCAAACAECAKACREFSA